MPTYFISVFQKLWKLCLFKPIPMIFPKHIFMGFFWRAGISNFFYWCSFTLHKLFAVGIHIVQVLECHHAKWNKSLPVSLPVKIISRTATHSQIPSSFRRGNHGCIHVRQKKELNLSPWLSDE